MTEITDLRCGQRQDSQNHSECYFLNTSSLYNYMFLFFPQFFHTHRLWLRLLHRSPCRHVLVSLCIIRDCVTSTLTGTALIRQPVPHLFIPAKKNMNQSDKKQRRKKFNNSLVHRQKKCWRGQQVSGVCGHER